MSEEIKARASKAKKPRVDKNYNNGVGALFR